MIDLNTHINNYGKVDAIIDFNGNNGILAGIWGFDDLGKNPSRFRRYCSMVTLWVEQKKYRLNLA